MELLYLKGVHYVHFFFVYLAVNKQITDKTLKHFSLIAEHSGSIEICRGTYIYGRCV